MFELEGNWRSEAESGSEGPFALACGPERPCNFAPPEGMGWYQRGQNLVGCLEVVDTWRSRHGL